MKKLLAGIFVVLAIGSLQLHAKGSASSPDNNKWKVTNIAWVKCHENDLGKDYKYVVLIGKVTKKVDSDTYLFSDDTGTIELDSDLALPVGKDIVVRGEIDQAYLHIGPLELNVESWRHVKNLGEVIK